MKQNKNYERTEINPLSLVALYSVPYISTCPPSPTRILLPYCISPRISSQPPLWTTKTAHIPGRARFVQMT